MSLTFAAILQSAFFSFCSHRLAILSKGGTRNTHNITPTTPSTSNSVTTAITHPHINAFRCFCRLRSSHVSLSLASAHTPLIDQDTIFLLTCVESALLWVLWVTKMGSTSRLRRCAGIVLSLRRGGQPWRSDARRPGHGHRPFCRWKEGDEGAAAAADRYRLDSRSLRRTNSMCCE